MYQFHAMPCYVVYMYAYCHILHKYVLVILVIASASQRLWVLVRSAEPRRAKRLSSLALEHIAHIHGEKWRVVVYEGNGKYCNSFTGFFSRPN